MISFFMHIFVFYTTLLLLLQCQSSLPFTLLDHHTCFIKTNSGRHRYLVGTENVRALYHSIEQKQGAFDNSDDDNTTKEVLENELLLIEAIEERNKAQIYSFIDEEDQWNSMEESERQLLLNKDTILQKLEELKQE